MKLKMFYDSINTKFPSIKLKKKKKNELIKPKKKLMFLYSYDPKNQPKLRQAQL